MKWRKPEQDFVDAARVARLATVDAQGVPHNVPICPLLERGKLYFGTEAAAKKARNLRVNPQVALVFDDYVEAWDHLRGILIQGRARIVPARRFPSLRAKLYAKYRRYAADAPLRPRHAAIVEVIPEQKFSWGLS